MKKTDLDLGAFKNELFWISYLPLAENATATLSSRTMNHFPFGPILSFQTVLDHFSSRFFIETQHKLLIISVVTTVVVLFVSPDLSSSGLNFGSVSATTAIGGSIPVSMEYSDCSDGASWDDFVSNDFC